MRGPAQRVHVAPPSRAGIPPARAGHPYLVTYRVADRVTDRTQAASAT